MLILGEGAKKRKKLTNVSFAFIHTYTLAKDNILPFFPKRTLENFEKSGNTKCLLDGRFGFKTHILKDNCPFKLKKEGKTNISPFPAAHTYIIPTFVSCFPFFWHLSLRIINKKSLGFFGV